MAYELIEPSQARYETVMETPKKIGAEGLPAAVKAVAGDFHPLTQMSVGAKALWDLAAMKLKQASGFKFSPEEQNTIAANRALLEGSTPALAGAMTAGLGAAALGMPAGNFAAARLAPVLPRFMQPAVPAAVTGAALNTATSPTLPGETNERNIQAGALGGAAADTLVRGSSRLVQPIMQSAPVQKLLNADIVPTLGQAAGGVVGRLEEKAISWPLIGDIIKNSRGRANQELNLAQLQKVDPDIQVAGREGLQKADQSVDTAYRSALAGIPQVKMTQTFEDNVRQGVVSDPARMLGTDQRNTIERFLDSSIFSNFRNNNGVITGEQAKVLDSKIGEAIRNSSDNSIRNAMRDIQTEFRDLLKQGATTPEAVQALTKANQMYKDYLIAVRASAKPGAESGTYTPSQLSQAVREGDRTKDKRAYAQGTAYGQNLSDAAKSVLSDKVPNSGTTDRMLAALLLGGGAATASHNDVPGFNMFGPAYWMALAASPLAYSRAGSRYMVGDLPGQSALSQAMRQTAPYAAQAGALYSR